MLMIPLPFVIALFVATFALFEWFGRGFARRGGWLFAFLGILILQEILIGLRFGYGFEALRLIQPLSAALLAPLAYLSFRRPAPSLGLLLHLLPLGAVVLTVILYLSALDVVLAFCSLVYAALLARLGMGGADALAWMEVSRARAVVGLLWAVVAVLVFSSVTDAAIAYDFWLTQGENTGRIAGWISAIALVLFGALLVWMTVRARPTPPPAAQDTAETADIFAQLEALMQDEQLHLDADINLSRIARRMRRPARDVSRAVNNHAGCNVSQYINQLRVSEARRLLQQTDMPVTQVIYASGFNTKSNFNREFARITGQTPSGWRDQVRA